MDTVYGTKKYFQSLSGASDIYRSQQCRAVSNDYTYQNTMGRRSTLGAYYHMNKQPSYAANEHSMNSQYGYNTWGIWRDGRNIAPSTFSTKTHTHYQKTRSFSIILTTAAFIVLLAVISIAGLAFYFSSIKANMEDPVFGFEGSFRIAKGDLYSTGLKYNHTTTYKQKIEFYKRFVERALTDNGLMPLRTDIWGFGEGPLIKVFFRTFLDVRKLPQNIHSVEEYIKESLFLETTAVKSLYRSIRIDAESVEIKRILDESVVKSASLFKEAQTVPTSQTQLEKRLMKKGNNAPPLLSKAPSTGKPRTTPRSHSPDDEPDIDVENAPVIQGSFEGSFEITKTDADIARKKVTPTKAYSSSLPPKAITPFPLRVKPKKPTIEKLTTIIPQQQTKSTSSSTTTTTTTTSTTMRPTTRPSTTSTTTTTTTTTTPRPTPEPTTRPTSTTTTSTSSTTPTTTTTPRPASTKATYPNQFTYPAISTPASTLTVPKLDSNLFTSIPVLDTQPWRPIHREVPELLPGPPPAFPTKTLPTVNMQQPTSSQPPTYPKDVPQRRIDEMELPFISENASPPVPIAYDPYTGNFFGTALRQPDSSAETTNPQEMIYYHSFGNPVFMPGAEGIERLGAGAHVQPHPLPVPLIDDVVIPPFRPLNPTLGTNDKLPFSIEAGDGKFEHLGGGVIAKKHDNSSSETRVEVTSPSMLSIGGITSKTTALKMDVYDDEASTARPKDEDYVTTPTANSELADTIGEFFMDLLNLPKDEINATTEAQIESRIEPDEEDVGMMQTTQPEVSEVAEKPKVTEKPEEPQETVEETITTTGKPNFLNLKEIILKRNQLASQNIATTSTTTPSANTTTTDSATTPEPTTKRNRIRPTYNKQPSILDESSLFPSQSKWEFVNSSATNNFGHTGNMRKVFNKTLQAWVSEDVEKAENFTLNDIKTRINNATNIQDISLIFDTLASKLGITPSVGTKVPPFSQNKMKHTQKNDTHLKSPATATTTTTSTTTTATPRTRMTTTSTTQTTPTAQQFIELPLQRREPFIKPMSSFMEDTSSEGIGAAIAVVGEAEVEVIDPTKYEEMLKSSQFAETSTTETAHRLVTLLPVRSNSGIRTYRPYEEMQRSNSGGGIISAGLLGNGGTDQSGQSSIKRKGNMGQSRRFPPPEAVVKGGLKVTVK